ncbi:hypothetical protein B0T21DRAFT_187 [Apiosordaria backusii]|uniref:Secreted protein n=1 Tax=Apiosordaria backusii TaxID=314023 RepID=A0AA40K601_9PEZI|nr:hypothetical protein B0T21DRAFT_187 [Apiosordaria backusii]
MTALHLMVGLFLGWGRSLPGCAGWLIGVGEEVSLLSGRCPELGGRFPGERGFEKVSWTCFVSWQPKPLVKRSGLTVTRYSNGRIWRQRMRHTNRVFIVFPLVRPSVGTPCC